MDLTLNTGQPNAFGSRECLTEDQGKNGRDEDGRSDQRKAKRVRKHTGQCCSRDPALQFWTDPWHFGTGGVHRVSRRGASTAAEQRRLADTM
jgi:hypothetical protein